jgi:hypothetical protein
LAFRRVVLRRQSLVNGVVAVVIFLTAIVTVGLTASAASPFSIAIRPAFMRLAVDLDVKIGTMHLHAGWSALPESTKPAAEPF